MFVSIHFRDKETKAKPWLQKMNVSSRREVIQIEAEGEQGKSENAYAHSGVVEAGMEDGGKKWCII